MGRAWIEDEKRPGGIGRSERERVFWERVASGRRTGSKSARQAIHATTRRSASPSAAGNVRPREARSPRLGSVDELAESLEVAIVTLMTVVVFGLGWATLETETLVLGNGSTIEGTSFETRYAVPHRTAVDETSD